MPSNLLSFQMTKISVRYKRLSKGARIAPLLELQGHYPTQFLRSKIYLIHTEDPQKGSPQNGRHNIPL